MSANEAQEQAPRINGVVDPQHFLQLHQGEQLLAPEIGRVLCIALDQGHGAIAVARPSVLALIERNLRDRGIDVAAVQKEERYFAADAATTLAQIMRNDRPDEQRFAQVVGEFVDRAYARFQKVSIFGEMVALLWQSGNQQAAIELEKLWNEFIENRPVLLYCAYPPEAATDPAHAAAFRDVCSEHCRVLHAEGTLAASV